MNVNSDDHVLHHKCLENVAFAKRAERRRLFGEPLANAVVMEKVGARKLQGEVANLERLDADDARGRIGPNLNHRNVRSRFKLLRDGSPCRHRRRARSPVRYNCSSPHSCIKWVHTRVWWAPGTSK